MGDVITNVYLNPKLSFISSFKTLKVKFGRLPSPTVLYPHKFNIALSLETDIICSGYAVPNN